METVIESKGKRKTLRSKIKRLVDKFSKKHHDHDMLISMINNQINLQDETVQNYKENYDEADTLAENQRVQDDLVIGNSGSVNGDTEKFRNTLEINDVHACTQYLKRLEQGELKKRGTHWLDDDILYISNY